MCKTCGLLLWGIGYPRYPDYFHEKCVYIWVLSGGDSKSGDRLRCGRCLRAGFYCLGFRLWIDFGT